VWCSGGDKEFGREPGSYEFVVLLNAAPSIIPIDEVSEVLNYFAVDYVA
jgi:hypothetical protein